MTGNKAQINKYHCYSDEKLKVNVLLSWQVVVKDREVWFRGILTTRPIKKEEGKTETPNYYKR